MRPKEAVCRLKPCAPRGAFNHLHSQALPYFAEVWIGPGRKAEAQMNTPKNSGALNPISRFRTPKTIATTSRIRIPVERVIDHCWLFIDGARIPGECNHTNALKLLEERRQPEQEGFVWLSLSEPTTEQMQKVAAEFGVHKLIVEDAVSAHQRPKVERYDDQLFVVVRSVKYSDFDERQESVISSRQVIETGELQFVIGPNFVITIRHNTPMPDLRRRLGDEYSLVHNGPMAVAWAVADALVDDYVRISTELHEDVDFLEEEVFTPGAAINVDQIYLLKREILEMRHAVDPLDPALKMLIAGNKDLINKQMRSYFRDILDHEILVKDTIAGHDERLSSLIDAAVAKITLQQNSDMRAISAFVGMAAVPTLIAGVYGMNFDNMPELHTQHGYYVVLASIVIIVGLLWWFFRKQDWL